MIVEEIMNKYPITVTPEATIQDVANLLVKHNLTSIPVVDEESNLLGIISEGDLLYKKVRPHAPHYVNVLGASIYYGGMGEYNEQFKKLLAGKVEELMTEDVILGYPDTDVEELVSVMVEKHLKVVPIVKGKQLVGLLSRHNIMKLIAEEQSR